MLEQYQWEHGLLKSELIEESKRLFFCYIVIMKESKNEFGEYAESEALDLAHVKFREVNNRLGDFEDLERYDQKRIKEGECTIFDIYKLDTERLPAFKAGKDLELLGYLPKPVIQEIESYSLFKKIKNLLTFQNYRS